MSTVEELDKLLGNKSDKKLKAAIRLLKQHARSKAKELKLIRSVNDRQARILMVQYYKKGADGKRHWTSKEANAAFRRLMTTRHKLHERIAKLVPEKIEPEFDSP